MVASIGIHYVIAFLLIAIYGIQVCPFLDSLTPFQLLLPLSIVFSAMAVVRLRYERKLATLPIKQQASHQFWLDLSLFVISGVLLALFNTAYYGFPLESGLKVLVGFLSLGFYIACHLSLQKEHQIAYALKEANQHIDPDENPYPMTRRFIWFASLCAVSLVGVVFLVISKDLDWLVVHGQAVGLDTANGYILGEITFIVAVIMAYVLAIIVAYSRNLALLIQGENQVLAQVTQGRLDVEVAVTSNSEFGLMAQHTNTMIRSLAEQSHQLQITRDASILGLASLAETRDNETGGHILRTQNFVRVLAEHIASLGKANYQLNEETIDLLYKSAPLHDVGKVGIPDAILLKPGKLTDEEFTIMKTHAQIGADALKVAEDQLGSNSFLQIAREISLSHHEKWDGSGYPYGLKGEDIPLSGRLMALADVYDALTTKRVYKPAFSHEKAKAIILEGNGSHFDPTVIDAFLALEQDFIAIAKAYQDEAPAH